MSIEWATTEYIFQMAGIIYFSIGIIDYIRWWNGSDENGDPK